MDYATELRELREQRDREIRRLRAERPELTTKAIAAFVGCSPSTVREVLDPKMHRRFAEARRDRWRARQQPSGAAS